MNKAQIKTQIQNALKLLKYPAVDFQILGVPKKEMGDYATNIAFLLASKGKSSTSSDRQMSSDEIATKIAYKLAQQQVFEKIEVVNGYINIFLKSEDLSSQIVQVLKKGERYFQNDKGKREKIMVEYSQPNTHKEFHIGHLRNVFIGSTLVNVLRDSNYDVIAANYIGDTGTHIGKCLWGLIKFHKGEALDKIKNKAEFLGSVYTEATQKIEKNPKYEKEFKQTQKKFDNGDSNLVALWKKTRKWSLDEFEEIYKELGVKFDVYFYESEEEKEGKKILPELLKKGIAKKSQGAIIANLEKYGLGVLVLMRKDGSVLYGLKDIPLAKKKFEKYNIKKSIYIVDVRQSLYFDQLFKILELYGFKEEMVHYGYEFVTLKKQGSMASRKGNIISAKSLIDDVVSKITNQYSNVSYAKRIGIGAIKFQMLNNSATNKIEFDIDESINLTGDTGPYVQYANARISSILNKIGKQSANHKRIEKPQVKTIILNESAEKELAKKILELPELIEDISKSFQVHKLTTYSIELARAFHSFYEKCPILKAEKDIQASRILLLSATQIALKKVLGIMGISAPKKM